MRYVLRALVVMVVIVAACWFSAVVRAQRTSQTPTFRASIALVPIDVRVVDSKTGKPITDLKQGDFTILEDNVRQEVRHFLLQSFDDEGTRPGAGGAPSSHLTPVADGPLPLSLAPQQARIFLIVLANGRFEHPYKALTALLDFLRKGLLPRDQVALFAYNRATDFTTDHERIARMVERFRQENDAIKSRLDLEMQGLAGIYGSQDLAPEVQSQIDWVFDGAEAPYSQAARSEGAAANKRLKRDARQRLEDAIDGVIAAGRIGPESAGEGGGANPPVNLAQSWRGFDAFVAQAAQTLRDSGNLQAAIAYMRRLEGEKHLIYVSPGGATLGFCDGRPCPPTPPGLRLPRTEDYAEIARTAADARVALDVIAGFDGALENRLMRSLSEETGGIASIGEYSQPALARIDATTRTGYLLGYYPTNPKWDAAFRKIVVKVNRPSVRVIYRNGYHAVERMPTFDRRQYLTRQRIEAALTHAREVAEIGVKLDASLTTKNGKRQVAIDALVDASHLSFGVRDGIHVGQIDIGIVAMDGSRAVIGGTYKKTVGHLEYDDATFARAKKDGIPVQMKLPMPANTRYLRLIVYDYAVDLMGTASARVR